MSSTTSHGEDDICKSTDCADNPIYTSVDEKGANACANKPDIVEAESLPSDFEPCKTALLTAIHITIECSSRYSEYACNYLSIMCCHHY